MKRLAKLLLWLRCFIKGHPCVATGRAAILLTEWKCQRCGGTFVSHRYHGNALVKSDTDSDRIFRDFADAIRKSEVTP